MEQQEIQRLQNTVKEAQDNAHKAVQLVEAMTRRHAEQDHKLSIAAARIERLEKILKVEIQTTEKDVVTGPKRSLLDRALGR